MIPNVLITGGDGYIARNLKPLFEYNGYRVYAPSRTTLDLCDPMQIREYIKNNYIQVIIHTASKGGLRIVPDTFDNTYVPNLKMFENLMSAIDGSDIPTFFLGSGAEFDRRTSISCLPEVELYKRWPVDPYGLSKNIMSRRALEFKNTYVLRLFGCFNYDEHPTRFIRSAITNVKYGLPIEIHKSKLMDFFYLDDVYTVIDHLIQQGGPRHINLVYPTPYVGKMSLRDIAHLIYKHSNTKQSIYTMTFKDVERGSDYTGDGTVLANMSISNKLIGLEEGIIRTCKELL